MACLMFTYVIFVNGEKRAQRRGLATRTVCIARVTDWVTQYLKTVGGVVVDGTVGITGAGTYGFARTDDDGHVVGFAVVRYSGRGWGIHEVFYGRHLEELATVDIAPLMDT